MPSVRSFAFRVPFVSRNRYRICRIGRVLVGGILPAHSALKGDGCVLINNSSFFHPILQYAGTVFNQFLTAVPFLGHSVGVVFSVPSGSWVTRVCPLSAIPTGRQHALSTTL